MCTGIRNANIVQDHGVKNWGMVMNKQYKTTVKELIQILEKFPEDLPVLVDGYESGYDHFYMSRIQKLKYEPQNIYYDGKYQPIENEAKQNIEAVILQRMLRDD